MKLRFTATAQMRKYNGPFTFRDGDVKDVPDNEARRLMAWFGDNFSAVDEPKEIEDKPEKAMRGERNKLMKGKRDK